MSGRTIYRLCIDFMSPEDLLNWFESAREHGAFGYDVMDTDFGEGVVDERPKRDIGVREMDSIDLGKKTEDYKVSSFRDAGRFLAIEDVPEEIRAVLVERGANA